MDIVLVPFINALKVQNSMPPAPTGGVCPAGNLYEGVSKVLLSFSKTLELLILVSSQLKPVEGLDSNWTCSELPRDIRISLPSYDLSAYAVSVFSWSIIGVDGAIRIGVDV
jgi:hypothetical protein